MILKACSRRRGEYRCVCSNRFELNWIKAKMVRRGIARCKGGTSRCSFTDVARDKKRWNEADKAFSASNLTRFTLQCVCIYLFLRRPFISVNVLVILHQCHTDCGENVNKVNLQ